MTVYCVWYGGYRYAWDATAQNFRCETLNPPSGIPTTISPVYVDLNGYNPPGNWPQDIAIAPQ